MVGGNQSTWRDLHRHGEEHTNCTERHNSNTSVRHCGQLMESCSSRVPCCDPCASCRCRLFNTICQCWRLNHLCFKKT
uniref:Agouti domain-containing protein n=1 Tax=Echeneis naucrates TaxID=173247 RepID=A0A665THM1_ECHNA